MSPHQSDSEDIRTRIPLDIYKVHPEVKDPVYSTKWAACFDIHAWLHPGNEVMLFSPDNEKVLRTIPDSRTLEIPGGWRALVPTGLIFVIPWGYSVRVHARSGNAIKYGIILANSEGVVDCDYVEEALQPIINTSSVPFWVKDGDRMCQAELLEDIVADIRITQHRPVKRANRNGGFGSTGGFGPQEENPS